LEAAQEKGAHMKAKRDWAERAARRLFSMHYGAITISAVTRLLRRARKLKEAERKEAEKQGIIWAYYHYEQAELLVSGELSWAAGSGIGARDELHTKILGTVE
jgi:hypothetical protein